MEDLRYPIGKFLPQSYSEEIKNKWLLDLQFLPNDLEMSVQNLDASHLNTPYREGGWTVQQVVHHVADSHMNAYCRFKLGLTEDNPAIKPYDENAWSKLPDMQTVPVNISLTLVHALHSRWLGFLREVTKEQFERTVFHPEHKKEMSLWFLLGLYAWHGKHHVAHITSLRERMKW
ncbi:MAG: putative metal-dependent hydrolase [Chitinophagaceae bacterium]|nr:putative metal-dependent hydrolase [Chitinophagaceae bacterium]